MLECLLSHLISCKDQSAEGSHIVEITGAGADHVVGLPCELIQPASHPASCHRKGGGNRMNLTKALVEQPDPRTRRPALESAYQKSEHPIDSSF